jgi:hypothetical protein
LLCVVSAVFGRVWALFKGGKGKGAKTEKGEKKGKGKGKEEKREKSG